MFVDRNAQQFVGNDPSLCKEGAAGQEAVT